MSHWLARSKYDRITVEAFIDAWESSETRSAVAQKLGIPPTTASNMAGHLRRMGHELKRFQKQPTAEQIAERMAAQRLRQQAQVDAQGPGGQRNPDHVDTHPVGGRGPGTNLASQAPVPGPHPGPAHAQGSEAAPMGRDEQRLRDDVLRRLASGDDDEIEKGLQLLGAYERLRGIK